jgi:hypothetical protein
MASPRIIVVGGAIRKGGMKNLVIMLSLLVFAMPVGHCQVNQPPQDETVVIAIDKTMVAVGTEVTIVATITNVSDHPIEELVAPGPGDVPTMLRLIVHDEKKKLLSEKPPDQTPCQGKLGCEIIKLDGGSNRDISLAPGKSLRKSINLSELYDLSKPGKYTVQVAYIGRLIPISSFTQPVMSNLLTVTVAPQ